MPGVQVRGEGAAVWRSPPGVGGERLKGRPGGPTQEDAASAPCSYQGQGQVHVAPVGPVLLRWFIKLKP